MPLSREGNAARMREQREIASEVIKAKLADEAAAFAAAIAPVPPEEEAALAATSSAKLLRAKERIIDFKFNFHDYLRKKSCEKLLRAKARSEARSAVTQKKLADEAAAFAAAIAPVPPEEEAALAVTILEPTPNERQPL